jgi:hypothetical protein
MGHVTEAINALLPEMWMHNNDVTAGISDYRPWPRTRSRCVGMIWAGVPKFLSHKTDEEGGRILDLYTTGDTPTQVYIRLSPAPAEGSQFAFVPLKVNRRSELIQARFGDQVVERPVRLGVSSVNTGHFRVDKIAVAAAALADPTNPNPNSVEFRRRLGDTTTREFMMDLMRAVYNDSVEMRNVLRDRDQHYADLVHLVADEAYPGYLDPAGDHFEKFMSAMNLSGDSGLRPEVLAPMMYNVVMPQAIFDVVCECLDNDRPPLVPQAIMRYEWMFNGTLSRVCPGLTIPVTIGHDPAGLKLIAGVANRFNLDLHGRAWYWPSEYNPPQEWIDHFVQTARGVLDADMPLAITERGDVSLMHGQRIPVFFAGLERAGTFEPRFSKVTRMEFGAERTLAAFEAVSCGPDGSELEDAPEAAAAPTEDAPGSGGEDEEVTREHCTTCNVEFEHVDLVACPVCEEYTCSNCGVYCAACETRRCSVCNAGHEGCTACDLCGAHVRNEMAVTCADCEFQHCPDHIEECEECNSWFCDECRTGRMHTERRCGEGPQ